MLSIFGSGRICANEVCPEALRFWKSVGGGVTPHFEKRSFLTFPRDLNISIFGSGRICANEVCSGLEKFTAALYNSLKLYKSRIR